MFAHVESKTKAFNNNNEHGTSRQKKKKNLTAKLYLPKNTDKIKYLLKTHSHSFTHTLYASDLTKKMNELTSLSLCVFQSRRELDVSLDFHGVCCWRLSVFRKSLLHSWKAHHHLKTERAAYLYCRKRNTMRLFKSLFFTHLLSSVFLLLFYCFEMRFLSRFVLFFVASLLLKFFRLCVIPSPSAFYHCFHQSFVFASRVFSLLFLLFTCMLNDICVVWLSPKQNSRPTWMSH